MKTRATNMFSFVAMCLLLASCAGPQKLAYLQETGPTSVRINEKGTNSGLYEATIKPKDLLIITVVTSEASLSKNYNLLMPQFSEGSYSSPYGMPSLQTYLVGNDGYIDFPIIGKIQVAGNTRKQLEDKIQKELEPAFNMEHPVINIRFTNYYVNILGEVARPGRYETPNDRLTIFEGLAMAGDLTIYGRRDNIKVLRENIDGTKTLIHLNLRDANIVQSPAYFLQQNDVVYVEPNKSRARSSSINSAETLTVSAVSIVISLASLLVNILYK